MQHVKKLKCALIGLVLSSVFLSGCAGLKKANNKEISDIPKPVPAEGYKPSPSYGNVALDENQKVQNWVNYFTGRGRKYMHLYLERSARYIPMMKATFRERGMPDELAYVAMIESGFSSSAFSHASAVGYWQFIRGTGKRYNLRIDSHVDERRDPILSTQAAATYLDSLYSIFGNWHLALAAYNAGEGRILRAVMKQRTRDFWELTSKRRVLAKETMEYVPKYIAAVKIASDPAKYGFTDIDFQDAFSFDSVVIERPVSLDKLAAEINVTYEEMKRMNPRYKSDFVPVYEDRVNAVRVPVGKKDLAVAALDRVASDKPMRYVASFEWYKVRKGDTLSHIARRFNTSIAKILDLNDLSRKKMLRVGQKLKVPDGNYAGESSKGKKSMGKGTGSKAGKDSFQNQETVATTFYKVQRGDTLSGIAAKNGISISELRRLNDFSKRSVLKTGTQLRVRNTAQRSVATKASKKLHVVRRGENLSTIARKYEVNISEIARANSLKNQSKLYVGARLVIPD